MESEIQTLGASTISLIKSTQVISSVYSAVKELAENALDAGTSLLAVRLVSHMLLAYLSTLQRMFYRNATL